MLKVFLNSSKVIDEEDSEVSEEESLNSLIESEAIESKEKLKILNYPLLDEDNEKTKIKMSMKELFDFVFVP